MHSLRVRSTPDNGHRPGANHDLFTKRLIEPEQRDETRTVEIVQRNCDWPPIINLDTPLAGGIPSVRVKHRCRSERCPRLRCTFPLRPSPAKKRKSQSS